MPVVPTEISPAVHDHLTGDPSRLIQQVGAPEGLPEISQAHSNRQKPGITSIAALRQHAGDYRESILVPRELPAVIESWLHAIHGETRELIALDQNLSRQEDFSDMAQASQRVGRIHLKRLRPLRDHRTVQRYLRAIEEKQAAGWHMLVFGLVLAVYAIPLRQGLVYYGRMSLRGLIQPHALDLELDPERLIEIEQHACLTLTDDINRAVHQHPRLAPCFLPPAPGRPGS